jgi:hypothetical protein
MKISFVDSSFIEQACNEIDGLCDAARLKVVGDPVRMREYETAEAQAIAFKAANYEGGVPQYVLSWQEAKAVDGWTAQMACDDILAAAARWEGALAQLRDMRLKTKEAIKRCTKKVDIDALSDKFKSDLATAMAGVA